MIWVAPQRNYAADGEVKSIFLGNIHMRTPVSLPMNASLSLLMFLSFWTKIEQWSEDSRLLDALVLIHSQSYDTLCPEEGSHPAHSVNVSLRATIMPQLDEMGQRTVQVVHHCSVI